MRNWIFHRQLLLLIATLLCASAQAQAPLNDLVYTLGTTTRNAANQDWSYIVVGAGDAGLLRGKRFAVFAKAGDPSSAATFSRRATLEQQTDPTAINALLNQSVNVGQDLSALSQALDFALRDAPGFPGQPVAQKLAKLFEIAPGNKSSGDLLRLLALNHPGVRMAAGQAFAESIAGVTTYEIRELNPATGAPGDVIGRVTITPGAAIALPGPGKPFQLVTNHPSDHLAIKLRWGTPDALRRLLLLNSGYNLWRMPRAQAEAAGFHLTAPTTAQLRANATKANEAPVTATKEFLAGSGAGAADDPADRTTYFFSDSNHRMRAGAQPFDDGEEFYYFVTARDILGRDGLSSPGGLGRACRRIPPVAPREPGIRDEPKITDLGGGLATNEQRFRITWTQNTNASELVGEYWVYRWPNPTMTFSNDATPFSNRVGVVAHSPTTNRNSFLDDFANSPKAPGLSNYWYTVRAVSLAACDPLLSPHSPPVSGVLRRRDGPEAPTGAVLGSCGTPSVIATPFTREVTTNTDIGAWTYRFTCSRRDKGIAWVQFVSTNTFQGATVFDRIYFPPDGDSVSVDLVVRSDSVRPSSDVVCVVGTQYGLVSRPAVFHFATAPATNERFNANFFAGVILATAATSGDPLLAPINASYNGEFCLPALDATADPSGIVTMRFNIGTRPPMMIQASSNGVTWTDVALATSDTNGYYAVSYPACLLGPLPAFRGCVIDLPSDPDCPQHIARASDDGAVAPIHIRFRLTPRTREYRVYRQVDDGPLTLLSQGATAYNALKPAFELIVRDDTMPVTSARLCYYAQLLDEHGNPSPMSPLGCKQVNPPALPRPIVGDPVSVGTTANPQVALTWFCATSGVYRFRILIERVDNPSGPSGLLGQALIRDVSINPRDRYMGLARDASRFVQFTEGQLTPPIGASFGPGPQFTMTLSVDPKATYNISVVSLNAQGGGAQASDFVTFTWQPPVPRVTVPWPWRRMPPVNTNFHRFVAAMNLTNTPAYPVGVRVGGFNVNSDGRDVPFVSQTNDNFIFYPYFGHFEPAYWFFKDSRNEPLLPVVLYRTQVTNVNFPRVSGDVTQVSPLIERIAWKPIFNTQFQLTGTHVVDPSIEGEWDSIIGDRSFSLFIRDLQPVIQGARYRYFLLQFKSNHEINQVIDAGEVTIPGS